MDREWMRSALPTKPPAKFEHWMHQKMAEEFIQDMLIFSAERIRYERNGKIRGRWISWCTCTSCTSMFETKHISYPVGTGFALYQGEDGCMYPVDPYNEEPVAEDEIEDYGIESGIVEITEGDQVQCPYCGDLVEVIHKKNLRGGRTRQLLGATVQDVMGYTAVIYWLSAKRWYDDGSYDLETYPRDAYVIGERGGLTRYRHTKNTGSFATETRMEQWCIATNLTDSMAIPYHDWRSINNKKVGGVVWNQADVGRSTGEKTGIEAYINGGGRYPITYLKLWRKNPSVENLINAGWIGLVEESICRYTEYDARKLEANVPGVDFTKAKPHEMLRMSKADYRKICGRKYKWGSKTILAWVDYKESGGSCGAVEFEAYFEEAGTSGVAALVELRKKDKKIDFPAAKRYMGKQEMDLSDLHYLRDAREMARNLYVGRELTQAELWPNRLQAAHDRLQAIRNVQKNAKETQALQSGFDAIQEAYGCLEWSDGDLRIILPKSNDELIMEGSVLQHCVGGYGKGHVKGSSVIFFVRKYRRPERSYFTLDIKMNEGVPREVQLHGFKNEIVKRGRKRRIPKRVRDFVTRWEAEVLMPWYLQQTNKKEKSA